MDVYLANGSNIAGVSTGWVSYARESYSCPEKRE
jgi:hypothetical protein